MSRHILNFDLFFAKFIRYYSTFLAKFHKLFKNFKKFSNIFKLYFFKLGKNYFLITQICSYFISFFLNFTR